MRGEGCVSGAGGGWPTRVTQDSASQPASQPAPHPATRPRTHPPDQAHHLPGRAAVHRLRHAQRAQPAGRALSDVAAVAVGWSGGTSVSMSVSTSAGRRAGAAHGCGASVKTSTAPPSPTETNARVHCVARGGVVTHVANDLGSTLGGLHCTPVGRGHLRSGGGRCAGGRGRRWARGAGTGPLPALSTTAAPTPCSAAHAHLGDGALADGVKGNQAGDVPALERLLGVAAHRRGHGAVNGVLCVDVG